VGVIELQGELASAGLNVVVIIGVVSERHWLQLINQLAWCGKSSRYFVKLVYSTGLVVTQGNWILLV